MKRFLFLFIACLSVVGFFSACINNNDNDPIYPGIGTINKTDDASAKYTITCDDSTLLLPTTTDSYGPTLKNGERVYVEYNLISTNPSLGTLSFPRYNVKILGISPILTKPIFNITPATQDSIGNDPIHIYNMWISGKYLNFTLEYYGGTMTHLINLVKNATKQDPASTTINLELRHNSKGDTGQTWYRTIVSFDISSLQQSGKTSLNISVLNKDYYNQITTKQITYTYTGTKSAISKQQSKINISAIPTSNTLK